MTSRPARSPRPIVMAALGLWLLAGTAGAVPTCLRDCDLTSPFATNCCAIEPCLAGPCQDFLSCRDEARTALNECIANDPQCAPGPPGRCTVILEGCVRPCQAQFNATVKRCARDAFGIVPNCNGGDCALRSPHARRLARSACNSCTSITILTTSTTTVVTTTSTTSTGQGATTTAVTTTTPRTTTTAPDLSEPCVNPCLLRIPSLRSCYKDCAKVCKGNDRATGICQQSCRNFLCLAIKARCTETLEDGTRNPDADLSFLACCEKKGPCISRDEAPCVVTTTTTTLTTTTLTVTTTSSTTTTTSGQF